MDGGTGARSFSVGRAFLLGAAVGAVLGLVWGWVDYDEFEIAFFYNHVLGSAFILGAVFAGVAALANWRRRNPL